MENKNINSLIYEERKKFIEELVNNSIVSKDQLKTEELDDLDIKITHTRCNLCENHCLLTINKFSNGKKYISGNRCEKGAELGENVLSASDKNKSLEENEKMPNLFDWKYKRLFNYYVPRKKEDAPLGEVGIPRVLNLYENYPLWFTFFNELGFRVCLSQRSSRKVYEKGLETIPSESVCYPGKISHGHVESLIQQGIKLIFYPCAPYEKIEDTGAGNHYNCPIVTSYPEVLKNNIDELRSDDSILYMDPFLPIYDKKRLSERLCEELLPHFDSLTKEQIYNAVEKAWAEQEKFGEDVRKAGEEALEEVITKAELAQCYERYGFGKKTNITLNNELNGNVKFTYDVEAATAGYGQGIMTTPIQLLLIIYFSNYDFLYNLF